MTEKNDNAMKNDQDQGAGFVVGRRLSLFASEQR